MKTVSAGYLTYRTTATSTRDWHFLKVTWTDGTILGFTNGDRSKTIDGTTYLPGFRPFAVQERSDLGATNTETEGGLSSDAITDEDIRAGKWDRAQIEYFRAKWDNLALGVEKISSGLIGDISRGRTKFSAELLGLVALLNQQIGRTVEPGCPWTLGDANCKVRVDPPVWTALTAVTVRPAAEAALGSVVKPSTPNNRHFKCSTAGTTGAAEPAWNTTIGGTTNDGSAVWTTIQALTVYGAITNVTSRMVFRDSARAEAADYFGYGAITFTSGANDGISGDIKEYAANGTITLQLPMPYDVAVSDTYEMVAGCRGDFTADCKPKFDNGNNSGAFPNVPGVDFLSSGKVGEAA